MNIAPKHEDVVAKLDAARAELEKANEKIDQAWNRSGELDYQGFIPGALDAWKRPVKQHLPYDFSGNPGASATQYCNGWNDSGGYWSAHAKDLQRRLTVAEQRVGELAGLLRDADSAHGNMLMSDPPQEAWKYHRISERISSALKPVAEVKPSRSCPNCKVCMGAPDFPINCLINGNKP